MKLAAIYKAITTPVPKASDNGKLRLGFLTSPAVKVTLFQASAENNDPTWATARIVRIPTKGPKSTPFASAPPAECAAPSCQKSVKFAATAFGLRPTKIPTSTSPASAETLA